MATAKITLIGWPGRGAALLRAGIQFQQRLGAVAVEVGDQLRTVAKAESPTGAVHTSGPRFADSWVTEIAPIASGARVTLGNTDPKASFVIGPTAPHVIMARHQTARGGLGYLRFMSGGTVYFRHSVNHPGTAKNDIPARVQATMQPRFASILQQAAGQAADAISVAFV